MDKNINKDEIEIKNENYYDTDFDDFDDCESDDEDGDYDTWSCDDDCDNWFENDFDDIDFDDDSIFREDDEDVVHTSVEEVDTKVKEIYKQIPSIEKVTDVMKNDRGFVRITTIDTTTEDEFEYDLEPRDKETEQIIKTLF
jgi:hypothetical protein